MTIKPPCLFVDEKLLPAIRQRVARILVSERGYSQSRTAELLGVTQAMVSKYLSRSEKDIGMGIGADVDRAAAELAGLLESPGEATRALCSFCLSLRESGRLCPHHKMETGEDDCHACMNLRREDNPRNSVLHTLDQAIAILVKENIACLIPEVRSNIAMCTRDPSGPFDVASVPGRLIVVRDRVMSPTTPEFNASGHTTRLLLDINRLQGSYRSLMNIALSDGVLSTCKDMGLREKKLLRSNGNLDIGALGPDVDFLIDEGAFGIEPCIYLIGIDALDVARKAVGINRILSDRGP